MGLDSFTQFVLDQLAGIEIQPKPMFGGVSLYHAGKIFGMTYKGELYLRGRQATELSKSTPK